MNISKQKFIDNFVITACAGYFNRNYLTYCSLGLQKDLENPPLEDIYFIAEKHWEKIQEFKKNNE